MASVKKDTGLQAMIKTHLAQAGKSNEQGASYAGFTMRLKKSHGQSKSYDA